jgi:hypothetical protein
VGGPGGEGRSPPDIEEVRGRGGVRKGVKLRTCVMEAQAKRRRQRHNGRVRKKKVRLRDSLSRDRRTLIYTCSNIVLLCVSFKNW